jgi:hypothetical protein
MNYELAKQLKDAGFPQKGKGKWTPNYKKIGEKYIIESVYFPTLSELIEACIYFESKYKTFALIYEFENKYIGWIWKALILGEKVNGKTPEEAVSKLWLELNK